MNTQRNGHKTIKAIASAFFLSAFPFRKAAFDKETRRTHYTVKWTWKGYKGPAQASYLAFKAR